MAAKLDWYGQRHEDRIVAEYLRAKHPKLVGRVLDLGAHDGRTFSNTGKLLEAGWGGVLVEPSPKPLGNLLTRFGDRADIAVVAAAVAVHAPPRGFAEWYDSDGDCVSSLDPGHKAQWSSAVKFRTMHVPVVTLDLFLAAFPGPFDLISIDLEAISAAVFLKMPFLQLGAKVVIVEHDQQDVVLRAHAEKLGFVKHARTTENLIFVPKA